MNRDDVLTAGIGASIQRWLGEVSSYVDEIRRRGGCPVIVALSRKMPRVMEWLRNDGTVSPGIIGAEGMAALRNLDDVEVVCEIALPFIVASTDARNNEYIIVDDILVTGRSMARTVRAVYELTDKIPYVAVMFISEGAERHYDIMHDMDLEEVPGHPLETMTGMAIQLSSWLAQWKLPIDMEYPVAVFGNSAADALRSAADASGTVYDMERAGGGGRYGFSVLLTEERVSQFNNDFAKMRVFLGSDETRVVMYTPNEIELTRLVGGEGESPFLNPVYIELWSWLTRDIRESYRKRIGRPGAMQLVERTLCVAANWMFSLSSLARHLPESLRDKVRIDGVAASWLFGRGLAPEVLARSERLVRDGEVSPSRRASLDLAPYIVPDTPEEVSMRYEVERRVAARIMHSVGELMLSLFRVQRRLTWIYDDTVSLVQFGESFTSLISLTRYIGGGAASHGKVSTGYETSESEIAVNRWMDSAIDNGQVAPRFVRMYEKVLNRVSWKRYFHATWAIAPFEED